MLRWEEEGPVTGSRPMAENCSGDDEMSGSVIRHPKLSSWQTTVPKLQVYNLKIRTGPYSVFCVSEVETPNVTELMSV